MKKMFSTANHSPPPKLKKESRGGHVTCQRDRRLAACDKATSEKNNNPSILSFSGFLWALLRRVRTILQGWRINTVVLHFHIFS